MSEDQSEYKADELAENGYLKEAIEMLGAGYDQPAAIIDPRRTVKALRDTGLYEYKAWGWVKLSAKFIAHLRHLKGAKLAIWQCIALSIDESGTCKMTYKDMGALTGYSHTEVIQSVKELEEAGYLTVNKDGKTNIYQPLFVARGENKPKETLVKKLDSSTVYQSESSPSLEKSVPSIKRVKRVKPDLMDGILHFAKQAEDDGINAVEEIIQSLERGLRVNITRTTANQSVARRILKDGRSVETWLSWVKSDDWRAARLYIYADLEKVWRDFPQAFGTANGFNPQGLSIE